MAESIIDRQRRDHAKLEELLTRYENEPAHARRQTFRELVQLVTTHAFAEEEVLFPAARKVLPSGEPLTALIESEHRRVNELLEELQGREPGDPEFDARVAQLFPILRDDARNEEDRLLPALARHLEGAQLVQIGVAWEVAKKAAPNRPHPAIPRRPPGNVLAGIPLFFIDRLRGRLAKLGRHLARLLPLPRRRAHL